MVLWRKHWLNGVSRAGLPFIAFVLVLVLGLLLFLGSFGALPIGGFGWAAGWLVLLVGLGVWLWWNFVDYRNDVYIVTDDRIIDIEMQPLGLNAKRREGAALVRRGAAFSLAQPFDANGPQRGWRGDRSGPR